MPLIEAGPDLTGRFLPAKASDLSSSPLYPLTLGPEKQVIAKALVLPISTEKSKLVQCGNGHFVHTKNLKDGLEPMGRRYTTKALCRLGNSLQFKLDPLPNSEHVNGTAPQRSALLKDQLCAQKRSDSKVVEFDSPRAVEAALQLSGECR